MSLTEGLDVFASAHEDALNDLIQAICRTRPRLLHYGSPAFVPSDTVNQTQMAVIAFPGVPGGIHWSVHFDIPHLDLFDQDTSLPPELSIGPGQFSISTAVVLCVDCVDGRKDGNPDDRDEPKDPWHDPRNRARNPICTKLELHAVGHLVPSFSNGRPAIGFELDAVEVVDIAPTDLESVLECLIGSMLRAVLADLSIPIESIRLGVFTLTPTQGPLIDTDVVLARGTI